MSTVAERSVLYTHRFRAMGGDGLVRFASDAGEPAARALARAAEDEALRLERKYSRYRERSLVSRIRRDAGRTPVAVDRETERLIDLALDLARRTDGAFDPTSGVLRRAWRFERCRPPAEDEVRALLPLVDHRQVSLRDGTVFLRQAGMELDLGGVVKEYAVDRLGELLREAGVPAAVVNLAGDVRCVGARGDGRPWRIGVLDPRDRRRCGFSVRLIGPGGVASSGDYERCFTHDGVRYHHLLDARSGWPARGVRAVTVVAHSTLSAGLAATAAFLLGAERGAAFLDRSAAVEGVLTDDDGQTHATPGMDRLSDLPGSLYAGYPAI